MSKPFEFKIGSEPNIVVRIVDEDRNPVDISGATTLQLKISDKDDTAPTEVTKTAVFTTDGKDGKLQYTVVGSEFAVGLWYIEARAVIGRNILTKTGTFRVLPVLF